MAAINGNALPPPPPHALYVVLEPPPPPPCREFQFLSSRVFYSLLTFLFVTTFALLMWLIFHPTFPSINVASATLSKIAATGTTLTAAVNLTLTLSNPNRHLSTIYDHIEISLLYPSRDVLLSQDYPSPFVQPSRNRTSLEANLSLNGVDLGIESVNAIRQDMEKGGLSFGG